MPGRRITDDRPLSPFGQYLVELCGQKNKRVTELARAVGSKARLSYALRGRSRPGSRGLLLTFDEISAMANLLRANRSQTRRLLVLGMLEYMPREMQSCVVRLIEQVLDYSGRLNLPSPDFDFSGRERRLPELP